MSEKDGGDATPQNAQDLTVFVQSLLEQMVGIISHSSNHYTLHNCSC